MQLHVAMQLCQTILQVFWCAFRQIQMYTQLPQAKREHNTLVLTQTPSPSVTLSSSMFNLNFQHIRLWKLKQCFFFASFFGLQSSPSISFHLTLTWKQHLKVGSVSHCRKLAHASFGQLIADMLIACPSRMISPSQIMRSITPGWNCSS